MMILSNNANNYPTEFYFEMEGDYQKIVKVEQNGPKTIFRVQICDHMAAIQREYNVDVETENIISIKVNDIYVISRIYLVKWLRIPKNIYV